MNDDDRRRYAPRLLHIYIIFNVLNKMKLACI